MCMYSVCVCIYICEYVCVYVLAYRASILE